MKTFGILCICLLTPLLVWSHDLKGQVVDVSHNSIVGAYIVHLPSNFHTHSNEFGQFHVKDVKLNLYDTLQVMHLGYETLLFVIEDLEEELMIELTENVFDLGEVVVGQNAKKVNVISSIDVQTAPVNSSQEILRKVPGLFIGQHAGGGKAEQIFLRGFDIDHGTDVHITVDGMPGNMVSHAHGQGYADLHFVIPETIEQIDYGKGPYYANKGNFATAGYVDFHTKDRLKSSEVSVEAGRFNALRTVGLFQILAREDQDAYFASEYMISDGPFESSQNFVRTNLMGKYTTKIDGTGNLSVLASHFFSKWDASGQIPERSVADGSISRFGAIDDTEGGQTSRTNLAITFDRILNDHTFIKNRFYYSLYDFELYSNFTFFLNDPINGDQIRQKENRQIYGFESTWNYSTFLNRASSLFQVGVGLRSDNIEDNELSRTKNRRTTLHNIQLGTVNEKNLYTFAKAELDVDNWLIEPSVRLDYFKFNYINDLDSVYLNKSQSKAIVSPKLNVLYNLNNAVQFFFKTGVGFHSNDARVVLEQNNKAILPAAYGADLGMMFKPTRRMFATVALWHLSLEQEFVYVGDEGIVEPSGRTRRVGIDVGSRYQINDWIFANADVNYAFARSIDEPESANLIPLAPIITATGGLTIKKNKFHTSLQFRYLKDRPANEDNSIVAKGYTITDWNMGYDIKRVSIGFAIENLFNQEWKETQFATTSRLRNELEEVEEIHFTPGTPFFIKGIVKYKF